MRGRGGGRAARGWCAGAAVAALGGGSGAARAPAGGGGAGEGGGGEPLTFPLVVNTWAFTDATERAFDVASRPGVPLLDALVEGLAVCEREQCDGSVGFGGSPDEGGETTLEGLVMDGSTMDVGAVADLRGVRDAASAARRVMQHCTHTILAGSRAGDFAHEMGLERRSLETPESQEMWHKWHEEKSCQPNYRTNVTPDPATSCGPYSPLETMQATASPVDERTPAHAPRPSGPHGLSGRWNPDIRQDNHDTIAMVVVEAPGGAVVSGASTNGANHKVPGRVGDSAVPGAGSYALSGIGGCGCTGDGDTMMRFLPCYQVVESMRLGMSPKAAAEDAIARIRRYYPQFLGALIAVRADGTHAGAVNCWQLTYSVRRPGMKGPETRTVDPAVPCPTDIGAPAAAGGPRAEL